MKSEIRLIACLSIFLILILPSVAFSAGAAEVEDERDVSVVSDQDHFHAASMSTGYNINDRFDISFQEGTITVRYQSNSEAATQSEWEIELAFKDLFEFKDNGNGHFDTGDTVISSVDLEDKMYSLTPPSNVSLPDGGVRTTITATSEDGLLTLVFTITSSPTLVGEVPISPTDVKLDIHISNYEISGDGDHIGLRMSVSKDADSAIRYEEEDDSAQLNLTRDGNLTAEGFFKWSDTALVDGAQKPVGASWGADTLVLSYPVGNTIVHDPVIGVKSVAMQSGLQNLGPAGNLLLYGVGLAFAIAIVMISIGLRIRKKT